jgi:nicotinamidase-related amidase
MDALLVIDMQKGMFADPSVQPHEGALVVARIAELITRARMADKPVVFVQHDGGPGDVLERGGVGFDLCSELTPLADEQIIVKNFCNAFQATSLADVLAHRGVGQLFVCGMQTEFCIDTTCRAAFEKGLAVTLIGDAHTTFDNAVIPAREIIRHHNLTLASGFVSLRESSSVRHSR